MWKSAYVHYARNNDHENNTASYNSAVIFEKFVFLSFNFVLTQQNVYFIVQLKKKSASY